MDDLELLFRGLKVTDTRLRATKGLFDHTSELLIVHGWLHLLSSDMVVEITIVDETDHLEWTCMTEPGQEEPFKMKIAPSVAAHRTVVTMRELRRIPDSGGGGTPDGHNFLVISERSCNALTSRRGGIFNSALFPAEKYPIIEDQPQLSADWIQDACIPKAVLLIDSNYTYAKIHYWRITVAEVGDAANNLLVIPWNGYDQRFEIPSNVLETGARYKITVEGLQLSGGGIDSFEVFGIVCRCSVTLETSPVHAFHSCVDFNIQIERSTFDSASLRITTNPHAAPASRKWKIKIQKAVEPIEVSGNQKYYFGDVREFEEWAIGDHQTFDFPLLFHPGHHYRVSVERLALSGGSYPTSTTNHSVDFRAELTLEDIRELHGRAVRHAGGQSLLCSVLYRNKSPEDFEEILQKHNGIMEVYNKDNSGDPASPINLRINGLFFMASVSFKTRKPFKISYFGCRRISIPAKDMLCMASKLYFADYYCMSKNGSHHVTLVMTRPKSDADVFCESRLLPLDVHDSINNPFLFYGDNQLHVAVNRGLRVEVLFTENVNILGYELKTVKTQGKGSSTPGGKCKYSPCTVCNLVRHSSHPRF